MTSAIIRVLLQAKKLNPNSAAARRRKAAQKPTTTNSSSSMPRASESNVFNQSFDDDLFGNDPFQTGSGELQTFF